jgi:small subunit ribosomal protein S6
VTEYEILLLLDPELPEQRQGEIVARSRELIERGGGRFDRHDVWGRRRLAYEIDRKADGTYHLLTFASEPAALDEVSRVLKITDGVLRHMVVRRPAVKRPAAKQPAAQPPVRESEPGEGAWGNREVPPATTEPATTEPATTEPAPDASEEAVSTARREE